MNVYMCVHCIWLFVCLCIVCVGVCIFDCVFVWEKLMYILVKITSVYMHIRVCSKAVFCLQNTERFCSVLSELLSLKMFAKMFIFVYFCMYYRHFLASENERQEKKVICGEYNKGTKIAYKLRLFEFFLGLWF